MSWTAGEGCFDPILQLPNNRAKCTVWAQIIKQNDTDYELTIMASNSFQVAFYISTKWFKYINNGVPHPTYWLAILIPQVYDQTQVPVIEVTQGSFAEPHPSYGGNEITRLYYTLQDDNTRLAVYNLKRKLVYPKSGKKPFWNVDLMDDKNYVSVIRYRVSSTSNDGIQTTIGHPAQVGPCNLYKYDTIKQVPEADPNPPNAFRENLAWIIVGVVFLFIIIAAVATLLYFKCKE